MAEQRHVVTMAKLPTGEWAAIADDEADAEVWLRVLQGVGIRVDRIGPGRWVFRFGPE